MGAVASESLLERDRELAELGEALASAREGSGRIALIEAPAGIGKTRIARELLAEASQAATVAIGRCLSYGEAITYHPLIEIVRQLGHFASATLGIAQRQKDLVPDADRIRGARREHF